MLSHKIYKTKLYRNNDLYFEIRIGNNVTFVTIDGKDMNEEITNIDEYEMLELLTPIEIILFDKVIKLLRNFG